MNRRTEHHSGTQGLHFTEAKEFCDIKTKNMSEFCEKRFKN